jgi:hypothetical protein
MKNEPARLFGQLLGEEQRMGNWGGAGVLLQFTASRPPTERVKSIVPAAAIEYGLLPRLFVVQSTLNEVPWALESV